MKKTIELCGLGNGLIDLQCEVSDEDFNTLGLAKGEMRLTTSEGQQSILNSLNIKNLIKSSGGSAANTIIAFAKFGGKAAYHTTLGDDELGRFYANEFQELGIKLESKFLQTEPTGTCLVLITPDSERTMNTNLGASALFGYEHINENIIKNSEWIYLEGYKLTADSSTEALFEAIKIAKKYDTKIAFTCSDVFVVDVFRENLLKVVELSDFIFCNENEAKALTGANTVQDAVNALNTKVKQFAVTMGNIGSVIRWSDETFDIPAYPAKPIDSTGAGDMFAGGFMYGLITTGSPLKAGHLGSAAAAKVVSQLGARLNEDHTKLKDDIFSKFK